MPCILHLAFIICLSTQVHSTQERVGPLQEEGVEAVEVLRMSAQAEPRVDEVLSRAKAMCTLDQVFSSSEHCRVCVGLTMIIMITLTSAQAL